MTMKTILAAAGLALSMMGPVRADVATSKPAPDFSLTDSEGKAHSLSSYKGKYVVLEWTNYGCPFVKKHYNSQNMQTLQKETTGKGIVWLSVCSSAAGKQGHMKPEEWRKAVRDQGVHASAVLLDPNGKVGRLYGAKTTPHMFIVDPKGVLIYQGAIDDTPGTDASEVKTAKNYVRQALAEAQLGKSVSEATTKSYGCSVKY